MYTFSIYIHIYFMYVYYIADSKKDAKKVSKQATTKAERKAAAKK